MLKKITLLLSFCVLISISTDAQYLLFRIPGNYTPLSNPTSLNGSSPWDDEVYEIPLGFTFNMGLYSADTVQLFSTGLFFGDSLGGRGPIFFPYSADLIDRGYDLSQFDGGNNSLSQISYEQTGVIGNRILKIQFSNAGFYLDIDDDSVSTDFVNYQMWVHEAGSILEMHMGPNSITQPLISYDGALGTAFLFTPDYDFTFDSLMSNAYFLYGNPNSPLVQVTNSFDSLYRFNFTIPNGSVYTVQPSGLGLEDLETNSNSFKLYPNPADKFFNWEIKQLKPEINLELVNLLGELVKSVQPLGESFQLNIEDLPSGIYFVRYGKEVKKLIVNN